MKKSLLTVTLAVLLAAGCGTAGKAPAAESARTGAAASAQPSRASLEELFEVSDFDKIMDQSFSQMPSMMLGSVETSLKDVPEPRRAAVRQVMEKHFKLMTQEINTPEMRAEMRRQSIDASAKVYTQGEVDALIRFYKSPEGRSVMAKMPQFLEATMAPMMQAMQPKAQAFQQKYGAQMVREINQALCGKNTCPAVRKK